MPGIQIIPFLFREHQFLPDMTDVIAEDFQCLAMPHDIQFDASYAYDPSRKQFN